MTEIADGVRGVSLLVRLNADRLLFALALLVGLMLGTYISHP